MDDTKEVPAQEIVNTAVNEVVNKEEQITLDIQDSEILAGDNHS